MSVYNKLIKIQTELKAPKGQFNSFGKYKYRNCEDILEALKPVLLKNKATIFLNDNIELIGDRFYIKATVTLVDIETGENITSSAFAREEESKKGMDGSQVTGASSSYARKYALNGMFAIDDTKDSDSTNTGETGDKTEVKLLTDSQVKRLYAIALSKNITPDKVIEVIKKDYKVVDPKKLTKEQYDEVCLRLEKKQ